MGDYADIAIKATEDWNNRLEVGLMNALMAAVEVCGRTGRQATEMAIVYMARSARAHTKQSKKNRKVMNGTTETGRRYKYVDVVVKSDGTTRKFPQFNARPYNPDAKWSWDTVKLVPSRGLAKRSWFWAIKKLKDSKPIRGAAVIYEVANGNRCGIVLANRLKYIRAAAGYDVEEIAARAASNQVMAQVAKRMEKQLQIEMPRLAAGRTRAALRTLDKVFKQSAKEVTA